MTSASERWMRIGVAIAAMSASLLLPTVNAQAVTIVDNYWGGIDTLHPGSQDVLGNPARFDIFSVDVNRVGAGGNTLEFVIHTRFAGKAAQVADIGYGALFLTPAYLWSPTGAAPYPTDVFQPGDWKYAFTMPQLPGSATTGSGNLYLTSLGTVVLSNINGNPISPPNPGNGGIAFREDQPVQYIPGAGQAALASGTWTINALGRTITLDIVDNNFLGANFALSWAMTCANDVIQGVVGAVPEPGTWVMMIVGFGFIGIAMRRRKLPAELDAAAAQ